MMRALAIVLCVVGLLLASRLVHVPAAIHTSIQSLEVEWLPRLPLWAFEGFLRIFPEEAELWEGSTRISQLVPNRKPVPAIFTSVAEIEPGAPPIVRLGTGADQGAKKGFQFAVYRGQAFVGKVVVERVHEESADARILFMAPGKAIQVGDSAATRLD